MGFDEKHYNRNGDKNSGNSHKQSTEMIISQLAIVALVLLFSGLVALCFYKPVSVIVAEQLGWSTGEEDEWSDEEYSSDDEEYYDDEADYSGDTLAYPSAEIEEDVKIADVAEPAPKTGKPYEFAVKDGKWGIISSKGILIPFAYDKILEANDAATREKGYADYFVVSEHTASGDRFGLVRLSDGKEVVPVEYSHMDVVGPVSFILVMKDGMYGCINHRNEIIIPLEYKSATVSRNISDDSENSVGFRTKDNRPVCFNTKGRKIVCD